MEIFRLEKGTCFNPDEFGTLEKSGAYYHKGNNLGYSDILIPLKGH
jgi:hypothetical protein